MKRIAIITHEYYPVLCGGTIFTEKLATELAKRGYRIEILTSHVGNQTAPFEKNNSVSVVRFSTGRKSIHDATLREHLLFFVFGLPKMFFYILTNRFNLIFSVFAMPSGLLSVLIARLLKIPTVVFVDAADTPGIQSAMHRTVKLLTFVFRFVTKHSDGVVILKGLEDLSLPYISNKNVITIANGTSLPDQITRPTTHGTTIRFLSIGRLVMRKGFIDIIRAFSLVKAKQGNFHLEIVGYGTKEDAIYRVLEENNLLDHITMTGRVEYNRLVDYYTGSDCYLFYGDREGSSLAMIEALSYGLPLIASDDPGNRIYVEDGKNGYLVEHKNPEKLAQAIFQILADTDVLVRMGKRSREIAESYSWSEIARQYENFFKSTISRTKVPHETHDSNPML